MLLPLTVQVSVSAHQTVLFACFNCVTVSLHYVCMSTTGSFYFHIMSIFHIPAVSICLPLSGGSQKRVKVLGKALENSWKLT